MIRVAYTPLMKRRVADLLKEINWYEGPEARDLHSREISGLTYKYLKGILSGTYTNPSTRVLRNLGLELWVRDSSTGELERIDLEDICDWNPKNPQMRASISSSSET